MLKMAIFHHKMGSNATLKLHSIWGEWLTVIKITVHLGVNYNAHLLHFWYLLKYTVNHVKNGYFSPQNGLKRNFKAQ